MVKIFEDRVAVVTGAGRGIGRAIAFELAASGAQVVVNDCGVDLDGKNPSREPADAVTREITEKGGRAVANYDTAATMDGARKIIESGKSSFGRVDILVNAAGILRNRMIFNMTEQEWDDVIRADLRACFACTSVASGIMRDQRYGRIVNITSGAGIEGVSGGANYAAATMAVTGLTKGVAMELGRYGVTANCVSPLAGTRMLASVAGKGEQVRRQRCISSADLDGGRGRPEDIAAFVAYLASDEAADVNGQVFFVTGGEVGLYTNPAISKAMRKEGIWTVDELEALFASPFAAELVNPAPAGKG